MEEGTEYLKLEVVERVVHGFWKARLSGYVEAGKLFRQWDVDDPNWKKYQGVIKKFVSDSNAAALEKGLEATLAFVENSGLSRRTVSDVVEAIVTKCLAGPKPKTKDLSRQIILTYCKIEEFEKVIEELAKGLLQKNPKTVSGSISCMTECLRVFGAKVIKPSVLVKSVLPLLDNRDKQIRDESKLLLIEAHRWIGNTINHLIEGCKQVQKTELEVEFEKLTGIEKPQPLRLLRSQQTQMIYSKDEEGIVDQNVDQEDCTLDDDPFDILEPVNILEKLPSNFYQLVDEKKWQVRKEGLDSLLPLCKSPRIAKGDFNDLTRTLKKILSKDTNIALVALSAQCLAGLAGGLREGFKIGAAECFPSILEKFKEKKSSVLSALREASDSFFQILGIESVQEDCLLALKHKTPSVVTETAKFLSRSFATCPTQLLTNKKLQKSYTQGLSDCLSNPDVVVRDAASEALGILVKIFGESFLNKLLPDLDALKMAKIKEFAQNAVLTGKPPKMQNLKSQMPGAPRKIVLDITKPKSTPNIQAEYKDFNKVLSPKLNSKTRLQSQNSDEDEVSNHTPSKKSPKRHQLQKSLVTTAKRKDEGSISGKLYSADNLKQARFKDEVKFKILKWNFVQPRPEFIEQLQDQLNNSSFDPTLITFMFHKDFKYHLKALEHLIDFVETDFEGLTSNLDLILKWATLRFFETNTSVLLRTLEYLNKIFKSLVANRYNLSDIEAISFLPYLVNKFGDQNPKVRDYNHAIMKNLFEIYPPNKISTHIMEGLKPKNSKQKADCLEEIASIIKSFGVDVLQPNPTSCIKEISKMLAQRDSMVRNAALKALTESFFQVGEKIFSMVGDIPEKELSLLLERVRRISNNDCSHQINIHKNGSVIPERLIPIKPDIETKLYTPRPKPLAKQQEKQIPRPKSRVFSLNLEKMENQQANSPTESQTTILKTAAIFLKPAEECDVILAKIMSRESSVAIWALSKANDLINHNTNTIEKRLDQLLTSCFIQYRHVLNNKLGKNQQPGEILNLVQDTTMVLMITFSKQNLVKEVTTITLQDLFQMIISFIVSPDFLCLADCSNVVKTLNILLQKMIDISDVCCVTCALLKLLKISVCSFSISQEFQDLVQKCLLRLTKISPEKVTKQKGVSLDKMFNEANDFMKTFPSTFWKTQRSSVPLNIVKTVIHAYILALGENALEQMSRIQDFGNSELFHYVQNLTAIDHNPPHPKTQYNGSLLFENIISNNNDEKIINNVRVPEKTNFTSRLNESRVNIQEQHVRQSIVFINSEKSLKLSEVNESSSYLERLKALRSKAGLQSSSLFYQSSVVSEDF